MSDESSSFFVININRKVGFALLFAVIVNFASVVYTITKYVTSEEIFRENIMEEFRDIKSNVSDLYTTREMEVTLERVRKLESDVEKSRDRISNIEKEKK